MGQFGGIVEVLDIVSPALLRAIPGLLYKVLDAQASTSSDYTFIENAINFEGLVLSVSLFTNIKGG